MFVVVTGNVGTAPPLTGVSLASLSASAEESLNELLRSVLLIVSMTLWKCFWSLRILVGRLIEIVAFSSAVAFTDTLGSSLSVLSSFTMSLALGGRVDTDALEGLLLQT